MLENYVRTNSVNLSGYRLEVYLQQDLHKKVGEIDINLKFYKKRCVHIIFYQECFFNYLKKKSCCFFQFLVFSVIRQCYLKIILLYWGIVTQMYRLFKLTSVCWIHIFRSSAISNNIVWIIFVHTSVCFINSCISLAKGLLSKFQRKS